MNRHRFGTNNKWGKIKRVEEVIYLGETLTFQDS